MSGSSKPPAKRLQLQNQQQNPGSSLITKSGGLSSDSDCDSVDDFEEVDQSDFSDSDDVEFHYQPNGINTETASHAASLSALHKTPSVNPAAGLFLLSVHEKCLASESDRRELVSDAKLVAKECTKQFAALVDNALKSKGFKFEVKDLMNVDETVAATCNNTFKNIQTKTQQERYFKETLGVSNIKRIPLGKIFIRARKGSVMKTKVCEQEIMHVPIEETIEKLINHPDYKHFVDDESVLKSDILDSYIKGELSKENKVLNNHPNALRFILYYDDVELCSPLKSRAGKQKVGVFYIFLENIPPKFRSSLKLIWLVGLVNANFIKGKSYGMDAALQVIVNDLKRFEEGVVLKSGVKVYGTLIATIGDNLAQHSLGGFKEGFTAKRCCRMCNARYDIELKTMTREDETLLRKKEDYKMQIQQIQTERGKNEKASREFGFNRASCLNELESFHILDNMPPDIMHDVLEGALSITVKRLLKYYLYETKDKKFSLDWLNQCIVHFDFDFAEIKDKPSELKEDFIKDTSSASLHQSASQLWLLATILPLILRPHVDINGEHWENFIDILEISRMLFTVEFPRWIVVYLKDCIDKYLSTYIKLYGNLIPKQHFMVHYPRLILKLGSLVTYMCMRCESNHKYYKRIISVISAYKNIPLFLARRDQLHQAYTWTQLGLKNATAAGTIHKVNLSSTFYGNLIKTWNGEVVETSWLQVNGVKFMPNRCFIVVGYNDHLPVFALIQKIIIYPEVAFVCKNVKTKRRDVFSACFVISLTDEFCVYQPKDMLEHFVLHAHNVLSELAIVSRYCIGGEP